MLKIQFISDFTDAWNDPITGLFIKLILVVIVLAAITEVIKYYNYKAIVRLDGTLNDKALIEHLRLEKKKLLIVSPGGAGKDFLRDRLKKQGLLPEVSYTSRPKREGEVEGYHYFYVTQDEFLNMVKKEEFLQYEFFNPVQSYYGTHKSSLSKFDIFIMTPPAIRTIARKGYRENFFILYLDIPEQVRRERLKKRPNFNVEARIKDDRDNLFKDFTEYDLKVTNPLF
jgi:guanylate kinase